MLVTYLAAISSKPRNLLDHKNFAIAVRQRQNFPWRFLWHFVCTPCWLSERLHVLSPPRGSSLPLLVGQTQFPLGPSPLPLCELGMQARPVWYFILRFILCTFQAQPSHELRLFPPPRSQHFLALSAMLLYRAISFALHCATISFRIGRQDKQHFRQRSPVCETTLRLCRVVPPSPSTSLFPNFVYGRSSSFVYVFIDRVPFLSLWIPLAYTHIFGYFANHKVH